MNYQNMIRAPRDPHAFQGALGILRNAKNRLIGPLRIPRNANTNNSNSSNSNSTSNDTCHLDSNSNNNSDSNSNNNNNNSNISNPQQDT